MAANFPRIISASRRSDIPAFFSRWFASRLDEGFCDWLHPFTGKVQRVSLNPADCLAIVFWTRNPSPMFKWLRREPLSMHRVWFHFTITGYPSPIESHNPPLESSIRRFRTLSNIVGPESIVWRYDPVVFSSLTPLDYHLKQFENIASELEGSTRQVYFSFCDNYGKTKRNFERLERERGVEFPDVEEARRQHLVETFSDIATSRGMQLYSCCEDSYVGSSVHKGRCIDVEKLLTADDGEASRLKRRPTREMCGCTESVDIGAYDTCAFGCAYCYATRSRDIALSRIADHDPNDTLLWRPPRLRNTLEKPAES